MYRRNSGGWMKHLDFIILDVISLQAALILAYACSGYGCDIYTPILYRNMAIFLGLMDLILLVRFRKPCFLLRITLFGKKREKLKSFSLGCCFCGYSRIAYSMVTIRPRSAVFLLTMVTNW